PGEGHTAGRGDVTAEHPEEGGLAGPVGPDEGDDLAGPHGEVDAVEDRRPTEDDVGPGDGQGGGAGGERLGQTGAAEEPQAQPPWVRRSRRMSQRKNGPPTSEVSIPSGRSASGTAVRATRSATARSSAPPSALAGRRSRCPGPATSRTRCGTTSPTKAMTPAKATPAPTKIGRA